MGLGTFLSGLGGKFRDAVGPHVTAEPGGLLSGVAFGPQGGGDPNAMTVGPQRASMVDTTGLSSVPKFGVVGSLLDRLKAPDSRGLTLSDKLFASGSILQGDSGGAATYLQNQRTLAQRALDRDEEKETRRGGLAALRRNIRPDGTLDMQGYLSDLPEGADAASALSTYDKTKPEYGVGNTEGGGLISYRKDIDPYGTQHVLAEGTPKAPGVLSLRPGGDPHNPEDWRPNEGVIDAQARAAGRIAGARAEAQAPFRAKPRPRARDPRAGYTADELVP